MFLRDIRMRKFLIICIIAVCAASSRAEEPTEVGRPLDIPPVLAGNFGELRPNHFHSGLDFKTQGKTGHKIHAIDDGYVSRATVSPWGFGRAVYVVHPETGLTSVYGHLEAFSPEIDLRVRSAQYDSETFTIDLEFTPGELPVRRGDVIALSGNAGSSFGPHLHMDIRDTATGDALDPMEFYIDYITDKTAPEVRHIGLYPYRQLGAVNGRNSPVILAKSDAAKGFTAWGKIYPAINAFDRMTGTSNIYGVKYLTLKVDGRQVYRRTVDRSPFESTRAVNTLADYGDVVDRGRWMMKTEVPKSEPLPGMIEAENRGIIDINEERNYKMEFILEDAHGNRTVMPFTVRGRRSELNFARPKGNLLNYDGNHTYSIDGVRVEIPAGALYDDINFNVNSATSEQYLSDIHTIGNYADPLADEISITIPLKSDTLSDKSKYCMVRLSGKSRSAVGGKYRDGNITARVSRFGRYAVTSDITAPKVSAVTPEKWSNGTVTFSISDNLSGVESYRGEIDGRFALFELDGKSGRASFRMDPKLFRRNSRHTVTMTATDACGNTTSISREFRW